MRDRAPRGIRVTSLAAVLFALWIAPRAAEGQAVPLDTILQRATQYVGEFVYRFTNVVAEESYHQETVSNRSARLGAPGSAPTTALMTSGNRRTLKSDFLLVLLPGSDEFLPFRDVFEVDGTAVRDREQRLTRLFLESKAGAMEQARKISLESARYNLGNLSRTFNNPIIPLAFLQANARGRFRFTLNKQDRTSGSNVWIVDYREQLRPTIIKGLNGRDIPARGQFWIDADTGRIIKSVLTLNDPAVLATLTTVYQTDERFQIDVPVEMKESYALASTRITGTATYGRFRRFDVLTEETVRARPAATVTERTSGIALVEIPAGRFTMGSPATEAGRTAAERQREITIDRPFFIGQHEVTQQEWRAVMGDNPSRFADCGPRCPVESVSFDDAQRFVAALNAAQPVPEFVYRLPTEAEWEYACRAGTTTPFSSGETITTLQANFNGKERYGASAPGIFRERPTRAAGFPANPWGLADVHGNVAEWTSALLEGAAAAERTLVIRSGSWSDGASAIRCAARASAPQAPRDPRIGLRIAADRINK